jgi:D-alanyl-D-alanine carboxypeptidase
MYPPSSKVGNARYPALLQLSILFFFLISIFIFGISKLPLTTEHKWVENEVKPQKISILRNVVPNIDENRLIAKNVFVYDVSNDQILFQKNAGQEVPIASITKLMTAIVSSEILEEDYITEININATRQQSASGLTPGDRLTAKSLIDFSLISSANDAAYSLAAAVGEVLLANDSESILVEIMNLKATDLKLPSFTFYNSTGLDVSTTKAGAYANARDVSLLMAHLYREYPEILEASKELRVQIPTVNGGYHNAQNTNRILSSIPNILGSKTGYTDLAGGNLTIMFDAGFNRPIVVTVLGSTFFGRFDDMAYIIETVTESFNEAS